MSTKYQIMIVDDEPLARLGLATSLAKHPDIEIVAQADSIKQARQLLAEHRPIDGLFLDINMEGTGESERAGLDFADELSLQMPVPWIVFFSAYIKEYAEEAFQKFPLSFLGKPYHEESLDKILLRIRQTKPQIKKPVELHHTLLRGCKEIGFIHPDNMVYISANNCSNSVKIRLNNGKTIERVAEKLKTCLIFNDDFLQVHKSHIVNMQYVSGWRTYSDEKYTVTFSQGEEELPIGRAFFQDFKKRLNQLHIR